jgi:hypothetical protein
LAEIEELASETLFPATYAALAREAERAQQLLMGPGGSALVLDPGAAFAAEAKAQIAKTILRGRGLEATSDALFALESRLSLETRVKAPASALRKLLRGSTAVQDILGLRIIVRKQRR